MPNNVAVEFTIGQRQAVETAFTINASPTKVSQLENDLDFQTKDEVDTALEGKQDVLTAGEGITIEDNVISATGATITIDDELSTTSENPVQNKVVTSAINQNHTEIGNIGQTIGTYGDIVTHNVNEFATASQGEKADSALQSGDNVSELENDAGYITSSALSGYATENYVDTADQNLQGQIDAIVASSDVFDIVGTYAELQAYDISTVPVNDIIKVLIDSTHENASTYYRCVETGGVKSWSYIGTEGAYYTKAQSDARFATSAQGALADTAVQPSDLATVATTGSYNDLLNKPTIPDTTYMVTTNTAQTISANKTFHNAELITDNMITLNGSTSFLRGLKGIEYRNLIKLNSSGVTAGSSNEVLTLNGSGTRPKYNSSDVALYSDIPTVNDATLTIQKNGVDVQTFTANASTNATANITVPTDTGDLTNGAGFITSSDLPTNYVTTNTAQDISAQKTFLGEKAILFKQTATTDKLGFTLYNNANTELGAFEWRPDTISGGALLNLNMSYSSSNYLGFRYWGTAVNIIAPKVATAGNYYIPVNVTNGNTTVTATSAGTVNISSLLPTVNNPTITITQGGVTKGSFTLNQATNQTIALDAGGGGGSYTAGTGIDITSGTISVTAPTLTNTATGTNSLTILGYATSQQGCVNIGNGSATNNSTFATAIGQGASIGNSAGHSVAIGSSASVTTSSQYATAVGVSSNCRADRAVAIGYSASARASYAIQLGYGTNSEANSFYVSTSLSNNWKMLGSDGLIPAARLPIATSVSSSSTNEETVGAKVFYDTCGDIETLINAL